MIPSCLLFRSLVERNVIQHAAWRTIELVTVSKQFKTFVKSMQIFPSFGSSIEAICLSSLARSAKSPHDTERSAGKPKTKRANLALALLSLAIATMTSRARALYGPRDEEYTLPLQDSESILLLGLLPNEIER